MLSLGRPAPPLGDVIWDGPTTVIFYNEEPSAKYFQYRNFTKTFNNLVFASGEATHSIYNVAAVNASRDKVETCVMSRERFTGSSTAPPTFLCFCWLLCYASSSVDSWLPSWWLPP